MEKVLIMRFNNAEINATEGERTQPQAILSEFVGPIKSSLRENLQALFGIPETVGLRWRPLISPADSALLEVIIGEHEPLAFSLGLPVENGKPWFRGTRLWINLRGRVAYSNSEKAMLKTLYR